MRVELHGSKSQFHYTYHLGQLELLRQLTGRTEKLI